AEAIWAVRHEMARNLDDILSRRTRALVLARDAATQTAVTVARLVAGELEWSSLDVEREARLARSTGET
ncbi:MAG: FAD-dependent oxidoreductase, partial [Actinomycetota bacterium]|nr:FAD-dependent oxidoreductase [Actinomycetota bacterium]